MLCLLVSSDLCADSLIKPLVNLNKEHKTNLESYN
jgi:hypothetical protein